MDKTADERRVRKIMEVMAEKHAKSKGERCLELMNNIVSISVEYFLEGMLDDFEKILTDAKKEDFTRNFHYCMTLLFIEQEKSRIVKGQDWKIQLKTMKGIQRLRLYSKMISRKNTSNLKWKTIEMFCMMVKVKVMKQQRFLQIPEVHFSN